MLSRHFAERKVKRAEIDTTPAKRYLRLIQREQTERLKVLLGRGFPEWTSLYVEV